MAFNLHWLGYNLRLASLLPAGPSGLSWELDLHCYFKRAKMLEAHHGATDVQVGRALNAAGD